jgi:Na+/H+ antiporter NhaD/arsenite permease-like protein
METLIILVFAATYLGMALGGVPGLKLDRTGVALVAVALLLASGAVNAAAIGRDVDLSTLLLLFALMIVSGQFAESGFYGWVAGRLAHAAGSPRRMLMLVVIVAGGLSALLANDIIAFAMSPVLVEGARQRGLDPRPFLIALAGACNAGSAMTVIGNPQNILIGQVGHLDFWRFLAVSAPPSLVALAFVYLVVGWTWRRALVDMPAPERPKPDPLQPPDRFQTGKGIAALLALGVLFAMPVPRDIAALAVAAILLISRTNPSRSMIVGVDWPLLLLFACLFTVTGAFSSLGIAQHAMDWMGRHQVLPTGVAVMTPLLTILGNSIGNVPAVMLILSVWPHPPQGAMIGMALLSTLAGNLLIVGSLANIIMVERAAATGIRVTFAEHARSGIPMTFASLAVAAAWLTAIGVMPLH